MDLPAIKPLRWVGSARADLRAFPPDVRHIMGTALYFAQTGAKHPRTKPFKGVVPGAGVLEIVDDYGTRTYRTVYTVRFPQAVFVLHAFQKKAKKGIKTPQHDVELIRARYQLAHAKYDAEFGSEERSQR